MPSEIKSTLGFDVSSALSSLETLDTALAKNAAAFQSLGTSLDSFNTKGLTVPATLAKISASAQQTVNDLLGVQKAQASLANLGLSSGGAIAVPTAGGQNINAMLGMADAADKVNTAVTGAGAAGKRAGDSMTLSWQTFARVIQTQMIIRSLNEVRDAMEFATKSFIEYSKTISEIVAIDPNRKFDEISDSVRRMSDAFNQPLSKVAEAQYQILSAQFTTVADQTNIMTAANELAKVTNQGLDVSVNILTGSLNAYGESSDMAGLRAAQFFETVSLGRVRTGDLATALGRVQTIAHLSGVSLEELDAAMISLSIGGVKSTEAATQLRGVLTALLKPSKAMKAAFAEVGVTSGPAAIATWGFQGAVQKLMESTGGAAEEMQKLMPNVRGFAGGARLAGSGADAYVSALKRLQDLPANLLKQKEMELAATDAEKLTTEINKIKNALTVDVGKDLTEQLSAIMAAIGKITGTSGGEVLGGLLTAFADQIPYFVAGIGTITVAFVAMKIRAFAATQGIGSLKMGLMGILALEPAAAALGHTIGEAINAASRADAETLAADTKEELTANQRAATIKAQIEKNTLNTKMQLLRQGLVEADKIYIEDCTNYQRSLKEAEKLAKSSFDNIAASRKSLSNELKRLADEVYATQESNNKKIGDLMARQSERNFERSLTKFGADTNQQFQAYVKHANDLATAATKMTAEAKDPAQKTAADEMWRRADAAAQTAEQLAKTNKDDYEQTQAYKLLTSLDTRHEQSLANQNILAGKMAKDFEDRAATAEKNNAELQKLQLEIEVKYKTLQKDEKEGAKGSDKVKQDLVDIQKLTDEYKTKFTQSTKEAISGGVMADPKVFEKLKHDVERELNGIDIKTITILPSTIASAFATLQTEADKMTLLIPAEIRKSAGTDVTRTESAGGVIDAYRKQKETAIDLDKTITNLTLDQKTLVNELNKSVDTNKKTIGDNHQLNTDSEKVIQARVALNDLEDKFKELAGTAGKWQNKDIDALNALIDKVNETHAVMKGVKSVDQEGVSQQIKNQLEAVKALTDKQNENDAAIKKAADTTEKQKAATDDVTSATVRVKQSIEDQIVAIQNAINMAGSLESAWLSVASAANQATSAANAASGGSSGGGSDTFISVPDLGSTDVYAATGGTVRGIDSVHAMLAPGEIVMNPQASQKFAAQLVAMNAGLNPIYRSTGGSVSNTGISGDVHINVNGAAQPQDTAREVIKAINREQRRGTSKIRG